MPSKETSKASTADEQPTTAPDALFRDPTPNENYTLSGVGQGLPTPETDEQAAETARTEALKASREL